MTRFRDMPDAIALWRATIEALEAIVLADSEEPKADPEIDPAAADDIHHLIMVRLAAKRRCALPTAWVRRPGVVIPTVADAEPAPETNGRTPEQRSPSGPAWRE